MTCHSDRALLALVDRAVQGAKHVRIPDEVLNDASIEAVAEGLRLLKRAEGQSA